MLQKSKKILALALTALFLSAPLTGTAAAAAPDLTSPMNLELRSDHRPPPRHSISHKRPAHSGVHHPTKHKVGPVHHKRPHHQPPRHKRPHHQPPPHHSRHHHHSSNDKLIGGLIAGAVIGAVIANNT